MTQRWKLGVVSVITGQFPATYEQLPFCQQTLFSQLTFNEAASPNSNIMLVKGSISSSENENSTPCFSSLQSEY